MSLRSTVDRRWVIPIVCYQEHPSTFNGLFYFFRQSDPANRRAGEIPIDLPILFKRWSNLCSNFFPFHYNPTLSLVEMRGFEPLASAVQGRRSPI
jgi:hypothetical protein